jgi:glycosyltransferase involved in cell wall biosynthesis
MDPVTHDQMPAVIAEADALIYTPLPDIHMDIALSLKIPEAIAAGCPVVGSRLSVNTRYFGEDGIFAFEPGNVQECVERLKEVYFNEAERQRKIAKAQVMLKDIAWERQAQIYANLLNSLTAGQFKIGSSA